MERSKWERRVLEKISTQYRTLFTRLGDCAILHLRNPGSVIQRVPAFWRDLVNTPDRLMSVAIAGNDLGGPKGTVGLSGHEQACHGSRHRKLALPPRLRF